MTVHFCSRGPAEQISGGYLYNRYVVEHLRRSGVAVEYHGDMPVLCDLDNDDILIVDSLVVDEMAPRLESTPAKVALLLHIAPGIAPCRKVGVEPLRSLVRRSRVIVTGEKTLDALRCAVGRQIDAIRIEPGVPCGWRSKTRYSESAGTLLCLANYVRGKGILRMLDVLHELRELRWTLTLHGNRDLDPAYFAAVRKKVLNHGMSSRIELGGPIPHETINECMIRSDLLVHFSKHETYSMVTAEAIACGLPVISYWTGNAEAFSRSGLVRYVLPAESQESELLGSLIECPVAYSALRRSNHWRARTWEQVGDQFLSWLGTL